MDTRNDIACYGCRHARDEFGNLVSDDHVRVYFGGSVSCELLMRLVDWWYWGTGCPDDCPLRKGERHERLNQQTGGD